MAVIRPFNPPVLTQPTPSAQPPVRARGVAEAKAAQRAFFQQALGDATPVRAAPTAASAAPAAQTASAQPMRAAQPAGVVRPIPDQPPARPMRPGSFIDIKV
ncbi:MAG TPA: hypothetical protein VGM25_04570 [Caulobacteraceae bacterium]|jgi:hypothetical protein